MVVSDSERLKTRSFGFQLVELALFFVGHGLIIFLIKKRLEKD
jgi:hypothetical protein